MTLHIKLPKGKTAAACERAGQYHSQMNNAAMKHFHMQIEAWRKRVNFHAAEVAASVSAPSKPTDFHERRAKELLSMAEACSFSQGDVYVSSALWEEIKGWYDA